ncbi:formimidoylglutamate deiminase [Marinicella sp. W31]|uniref:formimidoylglutamate deiminase n=1 Tax=Marinicella sp. W31 TaxID=3023713 RepID=UPI003757E292
MDQMDSYFFSEALLPQGWQSNVRLEINNGVIQQVQTEVEPHAQDQRMGVVIAAMPNCHSHVFQRAMAGQAEYRSAAQDDFWSWRRHMYELANRITLDDIYNIAKATYEEMFKAGYACVCEFHYIHRALDNASDYWSMSDAILQAAADVGIGLTLLPVLYSYAGLGNQPLLPEQQRFGLSVNEYLQLLDKLNSQMRPGQRLGVCFHSIRAVSGPQMHQVLAEVASGTPIHIHIAEQQAEVNQALDFYNKRPVDWLLSEFSIDHNWCLVHATHVNAYEQERLVESGAIAGLCPITEANLGDGIFPLKSYLEFGGRFAIGSDSHVEINPAAELKMLEYSQRLHHQQRNVACDQNYNHVGSFLWQQANAGGVTSSGLPYAGIQAGECAALVVLDSEVNSQNSGEVLLDRWIFSDQVKHHRLL